MKKITHLALIIPFITFGQWVQSGLDIDGKTDNEQFGHSLSLNADGTIVAIAAPFNGEAGSTSGQVRIYENQSGNWIQLGNDISGESSSDKSGFSISLSDDGSTIAIGAPDHTLPGKFEVGQARVFKNELGNWTQIGNSIIGENLSDHSGFSVSLSGDGNIVAIGAPDNDTTIGNSGHVRIYENLSGIWTQIGDDIDGEAADDNSGYSVSLNQDGSIVAIGAPFNDGAGSGNGQVRVYENQLGSWVQIGSDIDGEANNDRFGISVSLNNEGTIVAVGAIDNNSIGHARVFENQSGTWVQIGSDIDGEGSGDDFGISISLNGEGDIVAVGGYFNDGTDIDAGHVRVYKNQSSNWVQIDNDIDGEALSDRSGRSVSISDDGSILAIGANLNDAGGLNLGHARIYSNLDVLSTQGNDFGKAFSIYPNPTSGHITLNLNAASTPVSLNIYDALGKLVDSKTHTNTQNLNIDTSHYTKGIYLIKLLSINKVTTLKFIKQ